MKLPDWVPAQASQLLEDKGFASLDQDRRAMVLFWGAMHKEKDAASYLGRSVEGYALDAEEHFEDKIEGDLPNYDERLWITRVEIQERLDHLAGGSYVVVLMAMAEVFGLDKNMWERHLQEEDLDFILACLHVRHSMAHAFNFGRAASYGDVFDRVMASSRPFPQVREHTSSRLRLGNLAGHFCQEILLHEVLERWHD